ncbi:Mannose-6-phosphate isomerase [Nymphon striatum]|nr:Mannose-6-phosphate isomerase [Nymphon striatum]
MIWTTQNDLHRRQQTSCSSSVEPSPQKSTRQRSLALGINIRSLQIMPKELNYKPYVPRLIGDDTDLRLQFFLKLRCAIQSYKWGKLGSDSEVAKLSYNACNNVDIDDSSNYAELWMGTHPRGPSVIEGTNETLQEWITSNPECLGEEIRKHFGNKLPFLFKILSINKALSIQIHPNKEQAEVLFREDPERYPDPNHKPEIAIALTKFEAFCGFRPIKEIISFLDEILELQVLVGDDNYKELKATQTSHALKNCFYTLMKCDKFKVKKTIDELSTVFAAKGKAGCKFENDLFLKIHSQHPGDIGCFGVYFFNYIVMEPGQALYLPANVPHAYIGGDRRKWTWEMPGNRAKNQVDYILVNRHTNLTNVEVLNRVTGSDHRMVRATICINVKSDRTKLIMTRHIPVVATQDQIDQYRLELTNSLQVFAVVDEDIDQANSQLIKTMKDAAKKANPTCNQSLNKFSATTLSLMNRRNDLIIRNSEDLLEKRDLNKTIHKRQRTETRAYNQRIVETTIKEGKGYKTAKKRLAIGNRQIASLKNADGEIVTDREEILRIGERFYQTLYTSSLNIHPTYSFSEDEEDPIPDITRIEVESAIKTLKSGKSAGEDGISSTLIKKGGSLMAIQLAQLFTNYCIECMACSDNVLRCGLTPKFIDVDKLCELLTFSCGPGSEHLFTGIQHEKNPAITIFNPPIPDFAVNLIKFTGAGTKTLDGLDSASIIILIDGEFSLNRGKDTLLLKKGSVIFIPSNNPITVIQNTENVLMFQAYTKL